MTELVGRDGQWCGISSGGTKLLDTSESFLLSGTPLVKSNSYEKSTQAVSKTPVCPCHIVVLSVNQGWWPLGPCFSISSKSS